MFPFAAKPAVELSAPPVLFVGNPYTIGLAFTTERPLRIGGIDVSIAGKQGWRLRNDRQNEEHRGVLPLLHTRLVGATTLDAGVTRFRTELTLPHGTAPTHFTYPGWARMELAVRIAIPWSFDATYTFDLDVRIPPQLPVVRIPCVATSPGTKPDQPRLELSLASARLYVGETAAGSIALYHVDDREPREVTLTVVPEISMFKYGRTYMTMRGVPRPVTITLPAGYAGRAIPFELTLPTLMTPTFLTKTHNLTWTLIASTQGSLFSSGLEAQTALVVVDASAAAHVSKLTTPPRLGDERVAEVFAELAQRDGWTVVAPPDDEPLAHAAMRRDGDATLRIMYAYRGKDGTFLAARVAHPSLGLGLAVEASSRLRSAFTRDIEVGSPAWDRTHQVRARSPEQAIPALQAIVPQLEVADDLGEMLHWTDTELAFQRPVTALDAESLLSIARELATIAATIVAAQRDVYPPEGITVDLDRWRELARRVRGTFSPGDLSIRGELDQAPVQLGLLFDGDGAPYVIQARVGDPAAASEAMRAIELVLPQPAKDIVAAQAPTALAEHVERWPAYFVDLEIEDGVASARLDLGSPPVADADRARELVGALRALLAVLAPNAGPYR